MTEQTAVLRQDPPLLPPPASPDRAHRVPGDRTAIPGLHDPVASARVVVEAECGILVYPPEETGEPWRAVFTENGRRRFRQAMTEAELAAKLAKVTDRLRAGAPDMERPGADLIAHSRPGTRLPGSRLARRARRRRLDLAQPAARVLHHRPVHLETRRHRRVPHGRPRQLPHHPRHVRRHHQGRPGPRPPRHPITRYHAGHFAHPATKERHSHVPRKGKRKMSHPDPRHPAEANGIYPHGQPVHDSAITGTDTGMPDTDTRQYEEWHHADPPPRG